MIPVPGTEAVHRSLPRYRNSECCSGLPLNLLADRRHPPLSKLAKIEKPKKFLWSILPSIARSFSFCIAFLPNRLAPSLAVAYAYCRMLDTYEDVAAKSIRANPPIGGVH